MFLEFFQEKRKNCGRKGSYIKYDKKVYDIWTIRGHPLLYKKVNELEFIKILVNRKYELSEKKRIGINVFLTNWGCYLFLNDIQWTICSSSEITQL